jgi:hypothetical protein
VVKHEDAYHAMSSNTSGSRPREEFDATLEALEEALENDKTVVKDALKLNKFTLTAAATAEEVRACLWWEYGGGVGCRMTKVHIVVPMDA